MLAAAARMRSALRSLPLRAVHVDHGLQTGSDGFRARCAALAEALQVPLSIVRVAVNAAPGESIEAAARDARYAALAALLTPGECLLTAHHREDQAETVLLQALRGGFKGLSGMPVCRRFGAGWHVRPLLDVSRSELLGVGGAPGVGFASDPPICGTASGRCSRSNGPAPARRSAARRATWPRRRACWTWRRPLTWRACATAMRFR